MGIIDTVGNSSSYIAQYGTLFVLIEALFWGGGIKDLIYFVIIMLKHIKHTID